MRSLSERTRYVSKKTAASGKWLQVMVRMVTVWWRWWVGRVYVTMGGTEQGESGSKSKGDVL